MNTRWRAAVARWAVSLGVLVGIILVLHRWFHVNPTTVALTLLLFILVLAAEFGLRYAVVVAVLATAGYNYYFLPPIGAFFIADPQNWLALLAFLATAILASRLSDRAREQAAKAKARQRELEVLLHLSRELLQAGSVSTLLNSAPATVAGVLPASQVAIYLLEDDRWFQAGDDGGATSNLLRYRKLAGELASPRKDGEELLLPLRTGATPQGLLLIRGASLTSSTAEAIGGLISITIERAQALEVVARSEALKEGERLRNLMIDSITHELRTPLTSIKSAVSTLLTLPVNEQSKTELLTVIEEEADRLNHLVSEALEMAQLDAHQVHMEFAQVNVATLAREALDACTWTEEKHVLALRIAPGLEVRGDAQFLQKVVINLIENAAKYSAPGTAITVTGEQREHKTLVSVADHGVGISPAEQDLVFERFYRGKGQAEQTAGTGMGLALSRAIVEAHGGTLEVVSQPGRGSVFTMELPSL